MTPHASIPASIRRRSRGFSLAEMLVASTVLILLVALITQLFNSAQSVTGLGTRHLDTDEQARALLDRMAIDFGQMVKRADLDYFLKDASDSARTQAGNDQIAFFSQVPGFYSGTGAQTPFSLVGYRVNGDSASPFFNQLQRYGCGLLWSGSPPLALAFLPAKIETGWPAATDGALADKDHYELAGPLVFRLEYYYVLKGQPLADGTSLPSILSPVPRDTRAGVAHTALDGLRDVAAIGAVIAVIDAKSLVIVTSAELNRLAGQLEDFNAATHAEPGALEAAWQAHIDASGLPRTVSASIRVYRRWFYLPPSPVSS